MQLQCGKHRLDLSRPQVMGILNVTPDSFSDGGSCYVDNKLSLDLALQKAELMINQGAAIIDVGGESTRPGAVPISEQEEMDRVLPVVEALVAKLDALVSVDTSRAAVISASAQSGAGLINDVRALSGDGALGAAAKTGLPVCLMHMQGQPQTMQQKPEYHRVLDDVAGYLTERVDACVAAGIGRERILLDPGFGFGKTLAHNLALLNDLPRLKALGLPLLVGLSRKTLLHNILGRSVDERLAGSLALAMIAAQKGAAILRVHDVAETLDVLRVLNAVASYSEQ